MCVKFQLRDTVEDEDVFISLNTFIQYIISDSPKKFKIYLELGNFVGVSHGDDTGYILENFYMSPEETEEDKQMTQKMLDIWTSFAKTG